MALVVEQAAQQELRPHAALLHGIAQHVDLLPAEGIAAAQRRIFRRTQIGGGVHAQAHAQPGQGVAHHGLVLSGALGDEALQQLHAARVLSHGQKVEAQIQRGLRGLRCKGGIEVLRTGEIAHQQVQRILRKRLRCDLRSVLRSGQHPHGGQDGIEGVVPHRLTRVALRLVGIPPKQVDAGNAGHGPVHRGAAPGGAVVCVVGRVDCTHRLQNEAVEVVSLAVLQTRVELGEHIDGALAVGQGLVEAVHVVAVAGHAQQRRRMAGIALERLQPVCVGHDGGIPVLIHMNARQIQFVFAHHLRGQGHGLLHRRHLQFVRCLLGVVCGDAPLCAANDDVNPSLRTHPGQAHRSTRLQRGLAAEEFHAVCTGEHLAAPEGHGGLQAQRFGLQMERAIEVGKVRRADLGDRIPELAELLGLIGLQPGEVGLVVGVGSGHELGVLAVRVGQGVFPGLGELVVGPGEHLLARGDVVIRDVHHAAAFPVVVAAEEIVLRGAGEVGGRIPGVFVQGDVPGRGHVDAVVHVVPRDGIADAGVQVVEVDVGHVVGEEDLIGLVHRDGRVLPPQEGVALRRAVAQLHARLEIGAIAAQHHAHHALHPIHGLMLGEPADDAAVGALLDGIIAGHEAGGPVVVGPVELHAAGDPGAQRTDQRGLDHVLAIEEVIAGGLVLGGEDAPADLRQDQHVQIIVLHMNDGIAPVLPTAAIHLNHNLLGINATGGALMHPVFHKHGHLFPRPFGIGGDHQGLNRDFCFAHVISSHCCTHCMARIRASCPLYDKQFRRIWKD